MLIFLDLDGVLHPGLAGTLIYIPEFEAFLRAHPGVRVVFSTTWRLQESLDDLRGYFSPDLRPRFIGVTPEVDDRRSAARFEEIQLWLRQNTTSPIRWAALDDTPDLFPPGCPQLVVCDTKRGVRPPQLRQLEVLLELQHQEDS